MTENKEQRKVRKLSIELNPFDSRCINRNLWSEGFTAGYWHNRPKPEPDKRERIVRCCVCGKEFSVLQTYKKIGDIKTHKGYTTTVTINGMKVPTKIPTIRYYDVEISAYKEGDSRICHTCAYPDRKQKSKYIDDEEIFNPDNYEIIPEDEIDLPSKDCITRIYADNEIIPLK